MPITTAASAFLHCLSLARALSLSQQYHSGADSAVSDVFSGRFGTWSSPTMPSVCAFHILIKSALTRLGKHRGIERDGACNGDGRYITQWFLLINIVISLNYFHVLSILCIYFKILNYKMNGTLALYGKVCFAEAPLAAHWRLDFGWATPDISQSYSSVIFALFYFFLFVL